MQPLSDAAAVPERVLAAGAIAALLLIGLVGGAVSRPSADEPVAVTTSENTEATIDPAADRTTTTSSSRVFEPPPTTSTIAATDDEPANVSNAPATDLEGHQSAPTTADPGGSQAQRTEAGCLILNDNEGSGEWNENCSGDLKDQCGDACWIVLVDVGGQNLESVVDGLKAGADPLICPATDIEPPANGLGLFGCKR